MINDKLFEIVVLEREQAHYLAAFHYDVRDNLPEMAMYNQFEYLRLEDQLSDLWASFTDEDYEYLPYLDAVLIHGQVPKYEAIVND